MVQDTWFSNGRNNVENRGGGCASVGKAVTSNTIGTRFEYKIYTEHCLLSTVLKRRNNEKETGNGPFFYKNNVKNEYNFDDAKLILLFATFQGDTALHVMAKHERLDCVLALLSYGADINLKVINYTRCSWLYGCLWWQILDWRIKTEVYLRWAEPWSSGYGRRLMSWRLWVWIPAPYTGWTFFTDFCCKHCNVCLKRRK